MRLFNTRFSKRDLQDMGLVRAWHSKGRVFRVYEYREDFARENGLEPWWIRGGSFVSAGGYGATLHAAAESLAAKMEAELAILVDTGRGDGRPLDRRIARTREEIEDLRYIKIEE